MEAGLKEDRRDGGDVTNEGQIKEGEVTVDDR